MGTNAKNSAKEPEELRATAARARADGFIGKSVGPDGIASSVGDFLSRGERG